MTERDFVVDIARSVVGDLAPDELALFEPMSKAYLRAPKKVLTDRDRPGAVLGSGIDIAIALLSPVALGVATSVYERLLDKTGEAVVGRGARLFKRLRADDETPAVAADQVDDLCMVAVARAKELGLDDKMAQRVGEAVRTTLEREM